MRLSENIRFNFNTFECRHHQSLNKPRWYKYSIGLTSFNNETLRSELGIKYD